MHFSGGRHATACEVQKSPRDIHTDTCGWPWREEGFDRKHCCSTAEAMRALLRRMMEANYLRWNPRIQHIVRGSCCDVHAHGRLKACTAPTTSNEPRVARAECLSDRLWPKTVESIVERVTSRFSRRGVHFILRSRAQGKSLSAGPRALGMSVRLAMPPAQELK